MGKKPYNVGMSVIGFLETQKIQDTVVSTIMTNVFWVSEGVIHVDFRP
jgi:hypothetical protein